MALEIFKLVGSIMVNNDDANKSLQKTDEKAESVGKTLLSGVGNAAKWGAAAVAAGGVAAGAMVAAADKTAKQADEIDKMSQKLGMSREAYQEWDYVLSQNGMSIDSLQGGMKTLTNQLDDAINGGDKATEMFEEVGLSVEDLKGMSREDVFKNVVKGFQGMQDDARRAALANDLLGKSGANLAPLFNQSADSTQGLIDKTHELGLIMSDEMVDNGVNLTDTMDTLKRSFEAIGLGIGGELMPIVEDFANMIIDALPTIKGVIESLTPILTQSLDILLPALTDLGSTIFPVLVDLINQLLPFISQVVQAILPVAVQLLQTLLPPLMQIVQMLLPLLIQLLEPILPLLGPIIELLNPLIELLMAIIEPMIQIISEILPVVIEILSELMAIIIGELQPLLNDVVAFINDVLAVAFNYIIDVVKNMMTKVLAYWQELKAKLIAYIDELKTNLTEKWEAIKEGVTKTVEGLKDKVTNTFEAMKAGIKEQINAIIGFINKLIDAMNTIKVKIPDWVPKYGGKEFKINIPNVPYLAKGGDISEEGLAVVGEAGAELIDLPKGARVTPLQNGSGGTVEDKMNQVLDLLTELIDILPESVAKGVSTLQLEWNERELGRLVKAYE